jgi:Gylcosyl hydrolase family 115 C-terminal domain
MYRLTNKSMIRINILLITLFFSLGNCSSKFSKKSYATLETEEKNALIEMEAEHFYLQTKDGVRKWVLQKDSSASGSMAIKLLPDTRITHDDTLITGENFSNIPGLMCIVSYKIKFNTTGRYYVWVRALSTGSEDNSVHVGIDGTWPESGARMQWCDGKNKWWWESKQRTEKNHCGEPYLIYLNIEKTGWHNIEFSMREDGFMMDKFLLTKDKTFQVQNYKK